MWAVIREKKARSVEMLFLLLSPHREDIGFVYFQRLGPFVHGLGLGRRCDAGTRCGCRPALAIVAVRWMVSRSQLVLRRCATFVSFSTGLLKVIPQINTPEDKSDGP
jgi:hypothetical protein